MAPGAGYGGHGGSVVLKATSQIESFLDVPEKVRAEHGGDGHDTKRGKHGEDYVLQALMRQRYVESVCVSMWWFPKSWRNPQIIHFRLGFSLE